MFGAASFRLIVDALRGRRRRTYRKYIDTLGVLREQLARQEPEIVALADEGRMKATERAAQEALLEYLRALDRAISALLLIFENLEQDEVAYRDAGGDGRSRFSRDKLHYDRDLSELERLGTRLNRLFNSY
jgi:hypothetical protein